MGGFLGGFVTGLANSGSRQIQEEQEKKRQEELMQKKMMYEIAAEDYKAKAADRRKIGEASTILEQMGITDDQTKIGFTQAWIYGKPDDRGKYLEKLRQSKVAKTTAPSGLPSMPQPQAPQQTPIEQDTRYDSTIPEDKKAGFEQWRSSLPQNLQSNHDYDIQGAYLAGVQPGADGHMPDTFKKPNHPTFSNESQYSTPQTPGGSWKGEQFTPPTQQTPKVNSAPWQAIQTDTQGSFFSPDINLSDNEKALNPLKEFRKYAMDGGLSSSTLAEIDDAQVKLASLPAEEIPKYLTPTMAYFHQKAQSEGINVYGKEDRDTLAKGAAQLATQFMSNDQGNYASQATALASSVYTPGVDLNSVREQLVKLSSKVHKSLSPDAAYGRLKDQTTEIDIAIKAAEQEQNWPEAARLGKMKDEALRSGRVPSLGTGVPEGGAPAGSGGLTRKFKAQDVEEAENSAYRIINPKAPEAGTFSMFGPKVGNDATNTQRYAGSVSTQVAQFMIEEGMTDLPLRQAANNVAFKMKNDLPQALQLDEGTTPGMPIKDASGKTISGKKGTTQGAKPITDDVRANWYAVIKNPKFQQRYPDATRTLKGWLAQDYKNPDVDTPAPAAAPKASTPSLPGVPSKEQAPAPKAPTKVSLRDSRDDQHMLDVVKTENRNAASSAPPEIIQLSQQIEEATPQEKDRIYDSLPIETLRSLTTYEGQKPKDVFDKKKLARIADADIHSIADDINITSSDLIKFSRKGAEGVDDPLRQKLVIKQVTKMKTIFKELEQERFNSFIDSITDESLKKFFIQLRQSDKK